MFDIERTTLTEYLIAQRRRHPGATGEFNALILQLAQACKAISRAVAHGALGGVLGSLDSENVQGETQKTLDVLADRIFLRATHWGGELAGMVSEENDAPIALPPGGARGKYLLVFDPLDGSSNIDVNVAVGSIFSILRAPLPGTDAQPEDFLQPGTEQVAAGYAIYGPSTMLVLTVGNGVAGFTFDPILGEFFLTHPELRIPERTREFAINASNARFWEPPVRRYVDECLAGRSGPRDADFNMRWIASLVAETHRILMRGGVFLYPRDRKDPAKPGRLRLLYECNPIGMIVEQAGGRASTGERPVLEVQPERLHQRIGFVFGSREEVARIERYHREPAPSDPGEPPLFHTRSLFRQN
ncbi:class 1 fructose-bisphosphatase [Aromatoleum petrolei]|uniref:Fructose-1,6-bisphosphatase class 1 n=1 Tax=Aromatoleum petrolei TaxID=76116 RepID=A0ABX1MPM1_9RHOO|nr:class 1 fructose-bisphosphatase [Aromatoleum petrolei]NMF89902.1 class 1 fructose-bisphosphatase [Aromatoleum petrolei]QTQ34463.1 Fructose-1,6-bisphosphatase class 1 [Aromatoleum petrolei]